MAAQSTEVLAIVPAGSGSRDIPRKNIQSFAGHPLLTWSIAAAQRSSLVQRVVVSTDDEEIARVARAYGAEAPFVRPAELSRNDTRDLPVVEHALEWLSRNDGYHPDVVVQLRPTSPLRPRGLIDAAIHLLLSDERGDCVRSVTTPKQNPFKMWSIRDGVLAPIIESRLEEPYNAPIQQLPPTYWQTGHLDVIRTYTIKQKKSMSGDRIVPIVVDPSYALDIDELIHWRVAEEVFGQGNLDVVTPATAKAFSTREKRFGNWSALAG